MVGQNNKDRNIKVRAKSSSFLLLRPSGTINSDRVAREIALCDGVKDVIVSSGEYAFVVETDQHQRTQTLVRRVAGQVKICATENHFLYRRQRSVRTGFGIKALPSK